MWQRRENPPDRATKVPRQISAVGSGADPVVAIRLSQSSSSYLRQHADNPVDWWPWGDEALAEARRRDVPIMLSVGYASCHWCHVMAHESFSDAATAAQMNAGFVSIKVDREERPDVDAVYMTATQALTGQGGWPMTCFLTSDGRPFYAGTYFPPSPRPGMPSFRQLLTAIDDAWTNRRAEVLASAERIADAIGTAMKGQASTAVELAVGQMPVSTDVLDRAAEQLLDQWDAVNGGFQGAPKFPPAAVSEFFLRRYERTRDPELLSAVSLLCDRMGRGGIFDQLAGGFARYSVDSVWHVPHFEKMLDDNAQLLRVYAHHARLTGSEFSRRIAEQTAEFVLRDLRLPDGLFAASLDADTEGIEGATYLWTPAELTAVLGTLDAAAAAEMFSVSSQSPPELTGSVLRLPLEPTDPERYAALRHQLLQSRNERRQPARDELVVLRTNALAVGALVEAGAALGQWDWVVAAVETADRLLAVHRTGDGWSRVSGAGRPGAGPAQLVDLAEMAAALLALHQATGEGRWLTDALDVLDHVVRDFHDADGWWDTATTTAGELFVRPRDATDGAAPSGTSTLAGAMVTAAALAERGDLRVEAERILAGAAELCARHPRAAGWFLAVAESVVAGPLQVAVAGEPASTLLAEARRLAPGGSVVIGGTPDATGVPLLVDRPVVKGRPTAYVCRGFVCDRPTVDISELARLLGHPAASADA